MDFRSRVVDHYRSRGYEVRESARVRGQSGGVYAVDLVAQGPLGNIVLTFGGADGLDDADVAHIKRVAKDLGATPVAAALEIDPVVRRLAGREAVVLLDGELPAPLPDVVAAPDDEVRRWAEDHPWPGSGQAGGHARTALRSVALDDLLGDDGPSPAQAGDAVPASSAAPEQTSGAALDAKRDGNGERRPTVADGPRRFTWLAAGGHTFEDAEPAPRVSDPAAADAQAGRGANAAVAPAGPETIASDGVAASRPGLRVEPARDEVLQKVRQRVDGVELRDLRDHRGSARAATADVVDARGGSRMQGRGRREAVAPGLGTPEWVWLLRFTAGGAVAGGIVWALLRFG